MHQLSTDKKKRRVKPLPRRTKGNPLVQAKNVYFRRSCLEVIR